MAQTGFVRAERTQAKIKIAVTGPSGSGKTYSALRLAKGLAPDGKIAVIDTENGSASLYSSDFEFDVLTIGPPFETSKYNDAIRAAVSGKYDVLIIDSMTHAWSGSGGILTQKEKLDSRGGNSFANWGKVTPLHDAFIQEILQSKIHVIATMRSKQDYVLVDRNGKQHPQKVGLAPIQRDGTEYEFTIVFDVAADHNAAVSKDRSGLFDGKIFQITEDTGGDISNWLKGAKEEPKPTPTPPKEGTSDPEILAEGMKKLTPEDYTLIRELREKAGISSDEIVKFLGKNGSDFRIMPKSLFDDLILWLEAQGDRE